VDALGHAGAHRLEHQPRIERRRDQDDAAARVLFAKCAEAGRQLILPSSVEDQGAGRAILSGLAEIGGPNARDLQARHAHAFFESRIVAHYEHL
jgi:hypothetical protein